MAVQAVVVVFNHYLSVDYDSFTAKAISALGVLRTMTENDKVNEDIETIKKIISITSEDLYLSMYVLDRWVNPDSVVDNTLTLKVSVDAPDKMKVTYRNGRTFTKDSGSDYFLQKKLCEAIAKIHLIVMKNIRNYNVDFEVVGDLRGM